MLSGFSPGQAEAQWARLQACQRADLVGKCDSAAQAHRDCQWRLLPRSPSRGPGPVPVIATHRDHAALLGRPRAVEAAGCRVRESEAGGALHCCVALQACGGSLRRPPSRSLSQARRCTPRRRSPRRRGGRGLGLRVEELAGRASGFSLTRSRARHNDCRAPYRRRLGSRVWRCCDRQSRSRGRDG